MAKKEIMIVDDEPNVITLVKDVLNAEGYKVISADNGIQALKLLETVKPDLVILDMMMPYMSGREVCEKIRSNPQTKDLKVMFLTVVTLSEVGQDELRRLKVTDFIPKPFDINDLIAKIKAALA